MYVTQGQDQHQTPTRSSYGHCKRGPQAKSTSSSMSRGGGRCDRPVAIVIAAAVAIALAVAVAFTAVFGLLF